MVETRTGRNTKVPRPVRTSKPSNPKPKAKAATGAGVTKSKSNTAPNRKKGAKAKPKGGWEGKAKAKANAGKDADQEIVEASSGEDVKVIQWRRVRTGAGHTITFDPEDDQEIKHVGTRQCDTCVGVYFELNDVSCFVGHFNVDINRVKNVKEKEDTFGAEDEEEAEAETTTRRKRIGKPKSGEGSSRRKREATAQPSPSPERHLTDYEIGDRAFSAIRRWTKDSLNHDQHFKNWGSVTARMRNSLLMVCPHSKAKGKTYVGDAVVAGIKEWLGLSSTPAVKKQEAFIVKHPFNRRDRWVFSGAAPEPGKWQAVAPEWNDECACPWVTRDGEILNAEGLREEMYVASPSGDVGLTASPST